MMDRKNINRGFKKLRVWQDAVSLYVLACNILANFPFEFKKLAANSIDAAHSISRNISEGYCRRSLKEYLNHLNIALGSCGEFHFKKPILPILPRTHSQYSSIPNKNPRPFPARGF